MARLMEIHRQHIPAKGALGILVVAPSGKRKDHRKGEEEP
jgi:hypothetical protein